MRQKAVSADRQVRANEDDSEPEEIALTGHLNQADQREQASGHREKNVVHAGFDALNIGHTIDSSEVVRKK